MSNHNYLSIYAKSFSCSGLKEKKKTYLECSALYNFCRTVDNIADEEGDLCIKKNNLSIFKNNFYNKDYRDPIIKDMWDLINNFGISTRIVNDLFNGVESDLKKKVHLNFKKDLLIYSYRVAGTVGLMMAKILNVKSQNALKSAIDLGIAMQLTNISRDVVEDARNNRLYITANFDSIKDTLSLANLFYESSFTSIKEIPFSFRFSILIARRIYRQIGHNILKRKNMENYNASGKIYVGVISKIAQTILSVYDLIKLSLIKPKDHLRNKEHLIICEEINLNERI